MGSKCQAVDPVKNEEDLGESGFSCRIATEKCALMANTTGNSNSSN